MKYYFIAGEASGDLHGSNCMKEIQKLDASADFAFTGGALMAAVAGRQPSVHISDMAFMGFIDVLKNIGAINKNFKTVKADILRFAPDVLVLVDYPGFNLRMAKWAHAQGIKVDYYISPTVWAWKEGRVEQIRKFVNKLFVILPFEAPFYEKHGLKVYFVGHPLIDAIEQQRPGFRLREKFMSDNALDQRPIVAVLPGSRIQEIERMLPIMVGIMRHFTEYQFVVAGSRNLPARYYDALQAQNIKVVFDQTYELLMHARAGVIKSGTSTLESALMGLPQVVCYKGGGLSFAIGKRLVNVKYISLVNLIMDQPVVRELIQGDMTIENITEELTRLMTDGDYRQEILVAYERLQAMLGGAGASGRIAKHIVMDATQKIKLA